MRELPDEDRRYAISEPSRDGCVSASVIVRSELNSLGSSNSRGCAVRCVLAIKRREFLVLQTLEKEVSFSGLGDGPHRVCAQQLLQTPANTFASRQRRELRHRVLVLRQHPCSQRRRVLFHPAIRITSHMLLVTDDTDLWFNPTPRRTSCHEAGCALIIKSRSPRRKCFPVRIWIFRSIQNDPRGREPLIPLESVGVAFESYYAKTDGNNPPFNRSIEGSRRDIWLRKSVAEKLARVNELLRPFEAELFVLDGHRSVACQQGLWDFYYGKAKQENPSGSDEEHRARARQFIVNPVNFDENDSRTWPAHTNGAAIDLTLRDSVTKELLDMGANFEADAEFDFSAGDYFERQLTSRKH